MNNKLPLLAFATFLLAGCSQSPASTSDSVMKKTETDSAPKTEISVAPATTTSGETSTDSGEKSYEAVGTYTSPAGPEEVGVKLMIKDGMVTDVLVTPKATAPASVKWQTAFAGGVKSEVVGKKLSDLNVGKVAGSSLTGKGFNDAVMKIKAQM